MRACYSGFNSLSQDGLEGDDHYHLQLWLFFTAPADSGVELNFAEREQSSGQAAVAACPCGSHASGAVNGMPQESDWRLRLVD